MSKNLYDRDYVRHLAQLRKLAPEQLRTMNKFSSAVFKNGALSLKEKEIIAVTLSQVTQCPYCIDYHTKQAKKAGAELAELAEAAFVAASVEAGAVLTHGTNLHHAQNPKGNDIYYARSNLKDLNAMRKYAPDAYSAYTSFSSSSTKEGKLRAKYKELIALAVALAIQCPYCIDIHTKRAEKLGATKEEMAEVLLVTAVLCSGAVYAHMANMIESYQES